MYDPYTLFTRCHMTAPSMQGLLSMSYMRHLIIPGAHDYRKLDWYYVVVYDSDYTH